MNSLAEILMDYHDELDEYLYIGYARWDDLIKRIEREERTPSHDFADEQIWTFLVGCGYAIAGQQGIAMLTRTLTGLNQGQPTNQKIWFEVLPIPPRKGEGETHLDLALGTIARRKGTESGIELGDVEFPWICFCEMKWYSDISISQDGLVSVKVAGNDTPIEVGQIQIYRFVNPAGLKNIGQNLVKITAASGPSVGGRPGFFGMGKLQQGFLEMSNVQIVEEMVNMIVAQRAYELNSRAITTSDSMLATANSLKR